MRGLYFISVALIAIVVVIMSSIFIVDERNKALVLQFGRVVAVKEDPGLAFKLPLIQEVVYYDDRILSRDVDPIEVTPSDDRRLVVDAFARNTRRISMEADPGEDSPWAQKFGEDSKIW